MEEYEIEAFIYVITAFLVWALIEFLGLVFLVLIVKGIGFWEKSRNRPVRYAYLAGIGFMLYTSALITMIIRGKKQHTISLWDWTRDGWPQWYMPIFWIYIVILASVFLACLYLSSLTALPVEETSKKAFHEFQTPRIIICLGGVLGFFILFVTIELLSIFITYRWPSLVSESIYLWSVVGILVLLFLLIVTGVARLEKSKRWPVPLSYLVGMGYLVLTVIQSLDALQVRKALLHKSIFKPLTLAENQLSFQSLYFSTYWIIFATIVGCYLLLLILRRSFSIGNLWDGVKKHRGWLT